MKTFFWLLSLCSICGIFAQKPIVKLEIDPRTVQEGEMFSITLKTNIQGEIKIDYPSAFIEGYAVSSGMQQESDYNTGKIITLFYYAEEGMIRKAGNYTIGPAYVKVGGKTFKSNTVSVQVTKEPAVTAPQEMCAKKAQLPAFGLIVKNKNKVYQGEPVILHAKIYSRFYPSHFDDYKGFEVKGILEKHNLSGGGKLVAEETMVQNTPFYTFDYDRTLIFPTVPGRQKIDPFKLILRRGFDGLPVVSSPGNIEVLPLPSGKPNSFIGLVGNLQMKVELDKGKVKKNDIVHLKITLNGSGNIHAIDHPILPLPKGVTTYGDPKKTEDLFFSQNGAEGTVTFEYTLKIAKEGDLNFPPLEVSYFDPKSEKYKTLSGEIGSLTGDQIVLSHEVEKGETKVLNNTDPVEEKTPEKEIWRSPYIWLGVLSMIAIATFVGFIGKPRKRNEDTLQISKKSDIQQTNFPQHQNAALQSKTAASSGDFDTAIQHLEQAIKNVVAEKSGIPVFQISGNNLKKLIDQHCHTMVSGDKIHSLLQQAQSAKYSWESESPVNLEKIYIDLSAEYQKIIS
jgi:hypothetical protein